MSPSLLLLVLLLAATAAASTDDSSVSVMPGCQRSCGGVGIPYPFGIGDEACFRQGFEIRCMNNGSAGGGEIPVLARTNQTIPVLSLSVAPLPEARVLLPVAWQCFNSTGGRTGFYPGNVNFNEAGVYRISNIYNELYVLGCNTLIYVKGVKNQGGASRFNYKFYSGCVSVTNDTDDPQDGACAGLGCCHVDIPPGLTDTTISMFGDGYWSHADQEFCPCDYAFIVEKGSYNFSASDLTTHVPSNQTTPQRVDWSMPLRLDWAIRDSDSGSISCAQADI
ncbi:unnamed protein product [Miscanthus lutarioriparius]|uniref:Wall-associated receptor kinase galacturonan-binding domain-containing protein n=1 Tax=Miscanthus lutarioriparius TaxID=422564 RepID=A0A811Q2G8_9POAL|nr:unnamed protein product [Miscanthus lutarioriparius]